MTSHDAPDLVVLDYYMDEISAEMAKIFLATQGINAYVFKDDPAEMGMYRTASLKVEKYNFEKAKKILEEMKID